MSTEVLDKEKMSTPNILDVALSDLTPSEIATILPNILILEQKLSKTGHALDIARIDLYLEKKCLHGSIDRSFARIAKYRRKVSFYDHYKKQVQQALIALTKNSSSLFPPEAQYTISEILSEGVSRVASADYDQITSYQGRKMALAQYEEGQYTSEHSVPIRVMLTPKCNQN